jgi:hypothetical protein
MGPIGGKTPIKPKPYSFFSNLWHIEHDKIAIVCIVHSYIMGGKIRRTSMNVAFKHF